MFKRRALTMFVIALMLGGVAAWIANNWLQTRVMPTADAATKSVLVAATEIPYGQKIEPVHVKTLQVPSNVDIPSGVINDMPQVVGKVASQTIYPGEFMVEGRLVEQLGGSTLSALVTPNMRAITVRVNDVVGVAGFLLPGNRVDVIAVDRGEGAYTLLQDLKVLAVDQTASADKDQPVIVRAVTLEVTPKQAELLVKATKEGAVQLTLRNPMDSVIVAQKEEPKPVAAPKPVQIRSHSVSIIRGTSESKLNL